MAKTAFEAGWRVSHYNLFAPIPGTKNVAIANLFKGTCGAYSPLDLFLLSELPTLDAEHPILNRFRERGIIVISTSARRWTPWDGWAAPWAALG